MARREVVRVTKVELEGRKPMRWGGIVGEDEEGRRQRRPRACRDGLRRQEDRTLGATRGERK